MNNILSYRGYFTKIEYSAEDKILYGKIEGINDLINFESDSPVEIENEFHNAVDDYLELCKELGQSPDKAYSGTFNVRINPQLHREIALLAIKNGETLNSTVEKAIQAYTEDRTEEKIEGTMNVFCPNNYIFQNKTSALSSLYTFGRNYNKESMVISRCLI